MLATRVPFVGAVIDEAEGRVDAAVFVGVAEGGRGRRSSRCSGEDVDDGDVAADAAAAGAGAGPVGVVDLDVAGVDDVADDGDVAHAHAAVGAEVQDAADFGAGAALVDAIRVVPPGGGVAGKLDAGVLTGEGNALETAVGGEAGVEVSAGCRCHGAKRAPSSAWRHRTCGRGRMRGPALPQRWRWTRDTAAAMTRCRWLQSWRRGRRIRIWFPLITDP